MTVLRVAPGHTRRIPAGVRWATAAALALLTVPATLLAHLLTTGRAPSSAAVAAVAGGTVLLAATLPVRGRAGAAAVVAAAQAGGHTLLTLLGPTGTGTPTGCLPALGRGAEAGLRLAVLRHDAACPPGEVAAGPTATTATAVLLTAAVVLAGHAAVAVIGGWLLTAVATAVTLALTRLSAIAVRLPGPARPHGTPRDVPPGPAYPPVLRPRLVPAAVGLRAPPAGPCPAAAR